MFATLLFRFRTILFAAGFVFGVSGCMTDPAKEQPASERTSVAANYTVGASDAYKTPDSASWSRGAANGKAGAPVFVKTNEIGKEYSVAIELASGLGSDELGLDLWVRGIRVMTVYYKASGSSADLTRSDRSVVNSSFALALIKALDSSKSTAPAGKAGVDSLLAQWILVSDPRAANWKDSLPAGLIASDVVRSVLVGAAKTGAPLAEQSKTWNLGVSLDSAKGMVLELIAKTAIGPTDSAKLFPPAPLRVADTLVLAGSLKAGGNPVKLAGRFEWNDGLGLVALQYSVRHGSDPSDAVVVTNLPVPASGDRFVSLGTASVVALASAQTGEYTLVVTAVDGNNNRASTSVSFQVSAKDPDQPTAPRIRLLSPADKSTVPFETSEVTTTWVVTTPQGSIDSVAVDGAKADKLNDSTWSAKVKLEPTGKSQTVVARATNSNKLSTTETASLTREADKVGPEIAWITPAVDLDVDNGVNAITVRLKATDASGIDTVRIAGQKPDSINAAGEWVRKVPLTVVGSPMSIEVRVVDKAGNASVSSKSVTRANAPTDVPPKTILVDPASKTGTVVPFETKSVTVRWTITDPYGIDSASVTVNGIKANTEPDDKWSATVDLVAGAPTSVILAVKNKNGVSGGDVVAVTRQADTVDPSIELVAGSRGVGHDSAEVVVSCRASDNDSLVSVTIGGVVAALSNGVHSVKVKIATGDNTLIVTATDRTKNETSKEVAIHRYQPLVIQKVSPSADTTVGVSTTSLPMSWKITGAKSVWIGDNPVAHSGSSYTYTADLSGATARIRLWAYDSANHMDTSIVVVTRRDQVALSLSYGKDTSLTLPDSVVIAAASETDATLAWSIDGTAWTPFTGSFAQKTSGTVQVRAQVVGKDDKISSLKAFTLYHANHAPNIALTTTGVVVKSYFGAISENVAKVVDWGFGDINGASASGTCELQTFAPVDTTILSGLSVQAKPLATGNTMSCILKGFINVDTTMAIKVRFRVRDNGGTANGGVDLSDWTDWVTVDIVDTVLDEQNNSYRARRMPDGKVWMRSNMVAIDISVDPDTYCATGGCEKFGRLYSFAQAFGKQGMNSIALQTHPARGICPVGWHLSARSEWSSLFKATIPAGQSDSLFALRRDSTFMIDSKGYVYYYLGGGEYGDFVLPNGNYTYTGPEFFLHLPIETGVLTSVSNFGLLTMRENPNAYPTAGVRCVKDY